MMPVTTEDLVTCPVSLELFIDPVQTPCCGNMFNREPLRDSLPRCPLCRVNITEDHPSFNVDKVPRNRTVAQMAGMYEGQNVDRVADVFGCAQSLCHENVESARHERRAKRHGKQTRSKKRVLVPLHLSMTTEELLSQDLTDDPTDAEFRVGSAFDARLKQVFHESAIKAGLKVSTHISAIKERAREEVSKHAVQS